MLRSAEAAGAWYLDHNDCSPHWLVPLDRSPKRVREDEARATQEQEEQRDGRQKSARFVAQHIKEMPSARLILVLITCVTTCLALFAPSPTLLGLKKLQRPSVSALYLSSSSPPPPSTTKDPGNFFVPAFVGVWAFGYAIIALQQVLGGKGDAALGESGGLEGVAFVVVLALALFAAAAIEVFKPESTSN